MLFLNDKVIYLYIYNTKSFAGRGCFLFSIENKQAKHHLQDRAIEHNNEKQNKTFITGTTMDQINIYYSKTLSYMIFYYEVIYLQNKIYYQTFFITLLFIFLNKESKEVFYKGFFYLSTKTKRFNDTVKYLQYTNKEFFKTHAVFFFKPILRINRK